MKSKLFFGLLILATACLDDVPTSPLERLQKEVAQIDAYLIANPPEPSEIIIKDASGVTLVVSHFGEGLVPPDQENKLTVAYTGTLLSNGEEFDSKPIENPLFFVMSNLSIISGWKIALSMMTMGTIAKVYIPSYYAYGKNGSGEIPGNAILVFDMNLIEVELTTEQTALFNSQKTAISDKLEGVQNLTVYPSGITMIHTQLGNGATPGPYSQVEIKYSGKLMDVKNTVFLNETTVGPSSGFSSRAINHLHGLNLAFQQMQAGGKATVYVPATLAYGPHNGPNGVPANMNLVYVVELLNVTE